MNHHHGGASGAVNRWLRPNSVRHMSVTTTTQRLTAAHHETQRDKTEKAREAGDPQLTGRFRRWWQVLGSNQRRLSRRFYSEPIPTHRNSHRPADTPFPAEWKPRSVRVASVVPEYAWPARRTLWIMSYEVQLSPATSNSAVAFSAIPAPAGHVPEAPAAAAVVPPLPTDGPSPLRATQADRSRQEHRSPAAAVRPRCPTPSTCDTPDIPGSDLAQDLRRHWARVSTTTTPPGAGIRP
jgi:hypothetical protein